MHIHICTITFLYTYVCVCAYNCDVPLKFNLGLACSAIKLDNEQQGDSVSAYDFCDFTECGDPSFAFVFGVAGAWGVMQHTSIWCNTIYYWIPRM